MAPQRPHFKIQSFSFTFSSKAVGIQCCLLHEVSRPFQVTLTRMHALRARGRRPSKASQAARLAASRVRRQVVRPRSRQQHKQARETKGKGRGRVALRERASGTGSSGGQIEIDAERDSGADDGRPNFAHSSTRRWQSSRYSAGDTGSRYSQHDRLRSSVSLARRTRCDGHRETRRGSAAGVETAAPAQDLFHHSTCRKRKLSGSALNSTMQA